MAESTVPTATAEPKTTACAGGACGTERFISPAVDIFEGAKGLNLVADVPGLDKESIADSVENDLLTIKGAARQGIERDYLHREFQPVGYFRQFKLGNRIDRAGINAEYKSGVLHLTLPFAEAAKPRQIAVKVA